MKKLLVALGLFIVVAALVGAQVRPAADSTLADARKAIDTGRYADAEKLLANPAASAPGGDAALELGKLQLYLGKKAEGTRTLQRVINASPQNTVVDFVRLGEAERVLGQFQQANADFRQANQLAPQNVAANIGWGEVFAEKYNRSDAAKSFQAALMAEPDNVRAKVGMASLMTDTNPPAARQLLGEVLNKDPNYVPAHVLLAQIALDDGKRDEAKESLRKALMVNPNSLEARSIDAAIAFLEDRKADFDAKVADILKINPRYSKVYRLAAEVASHNYRYNEAADFAKRAVALDPDDAQSSATLGLQLLRTNDETGARVVLERAFKGDPYDVVTYNLLSMMDALDKFVTIRDGDVVVRMSADEAPVMREYVVPFAKESLAKLSKQWNFTPQGPILVEMFPKHDDFAVRTMGLPGMIGALGVCFGQLVAFDSPKARPPGEFSWQETLWHELTHVITIQMSNNRIPRWLTEGISVWEEAYARPDWGRETTVPFAQALEQNKPLKLRNLNEGFQDPELIVLSYYQASQVVDYLVKTYGEPKLQAFVKAFSRGIDTETALKEVYGVGIDQVQTGLDAAFDRDFGAMRKALKKIDVPQNATADQLAAMAQANPDSFGVHMRLAAERKKAGDAAGAIRALEQAAKLLPAIQGKQNPHLAIAEIALEQKNNARAIEALDAFLKVDGNDVDGARQRAQLLEQAGEAARASTAYARVIDVDPFDSHAQSMVGKAALQRKDAQTAIRAFRAALAAKPADLAAAHYDLAQAYLLGGQNAEAKQETLAALEVAPSFEPAQDLLLKIVGGG
ncbi:MAG TPA: tetratricopeptide repeat protein [Vicinamibacterales bacterium]|jgi:cellulose synthase operon protein C|nr:tetratricopeptide repeat protein [Vicinamibacterales bacterium]